MNRPGCGSGRDAKAFAACGYRVAAFDALLALAALASQHLGQPVPVRSFAEVGELQLRGADPVRPPFA